jgi:hypothetical protein
VDKEPDPPALLSEAARTSLSTTLAGRYDGARMDYLADPLVNTLVIRQVVAASRLLSCQLNRHQLAWLPATPAAEHRAAQSGTRPPKGTRDGWQPYCLIGCSCWKVQLRERRRG